MNTWTQYHLDNGLQLLVARLPNRNGVSVNVRVDAGGQRAPAGLDGIPHFLEHMLFQGTESLPSSFALTSRIEALGAELLGVTHNEYTSYWLETPLQYLYQTLPIFLEMLRHPALMHERIENERQVILEELVENQQDYDYQSHMLLNQIIWGEHPLNISLIGTETTLQAITPQAIRGFFAQHYHPVRMVMAVAGDVPDTEIRSIIDSNWPTWTSPQTLAQVQPPQQFSGPHATVRYQAEGSMHIVLGFITPTLGSSEYGALTILHTLLSEGLSSYLYTTLRGDTGLCYSLDGMLEEFRHVSKLTIHIVSRPEMVLTVVHQTIAIFRRLIKHGVSQVDLDRGRGQAIGVLLCNADHASFHARSLALSTFLVGKTIDGDQQLQQLQQVSLEDMHALIAKYIHPCNFYASIIGALEPALWDVIQETLYDW